MPPSNTTTTVHLGCVGCLIYLIAFVLLLGVLVRVWGWTFG